MSSSSLAKSVILSAKENCEKNTGSVGVRSLQNYMKLKHPKLANSYKEMYAMLSLTPFLEDCQVWGPIFSIVFKGFLGNVPYIVNLA